MNKIFLIAALIFISASASSSVEHTVTIVQRPDGKFDVTCLDGTTEVKTKAEVLSDHICTHLSTVIGAWNLIDGGIENGIRFCDLNLHIVRSSAAILKLKGQFAAPCAGTVSDTQDCNALSCSMKLEQKFYSFDFSTAGRLDLTRLEDGFKAGYRGNSGGGGGSGLSRARLIPLDNKPDILHVTNDGGINWLPVCDDGFGEVEAGVACKEMGFSGVQSFTTNIRANVTADYGLDDIACTGKENSLFDCSHSEWRVHNCDVGEHVQLVCR